MRTKTTPSVKCYPEANLATIPFGEQAPQIVAISDLHFGQIDDLRRFPGYLSGVIGGLRERFTLGDGRHTVLVINGDLVDRSIIGQANGTNVRQRLLETVLDTLSALEGSLGSEGIQTTIIFIPGNHEKDIFGADEFKRAISNKFKQTIVYADQALVVGNLENPWARVEHGDQYGSDLVALLKWLISTFGGGAKTVLRSLTVVSSDTKSADHTHQMGDTRDSLGESFKRYVMSNGQLGRLAPFLLLLEVGPRMQAARVYRIIRAVAGRSLLLGRLLGRPEILMNNKQLLIIGHLHPQEFVFTDRHNRFRVTKRSSGLLVAQEEGVLETPETIPGACRRLMAFFLRFLPDNVLIMPFSGGKNMHIVLIRSNSKGQPTIGLAWAPFGSFNVVDSVAEISFLQRVGK